MISISPEEDNRVPPNNNSRNQKGPNLQDPALGSGNKDSHISIFHESVWKELKYYCVAKDQGFKFHFLLIYQNRLDTGQNNPIVSKPQDMIVYSYTCFWA